MPRRCESNPCFTSVRGSKLECFLCQKTFHIKCAGLSNNQLKAIRDCPGAEWLCPVCRTSSNTSKTSSTNTDKLDLILRRTTSAVQLIGGVMDTLQIFCRMYSTRVTRCCTQKPTEADPDTNNEMRFYEQIDNLQINFTNLFESIIGTTENRPRTSSVLRHSPTVADNTEVHVPINQPSASVTTVPFITDSVCSSILSEANPSASLYLDIPAAVATATAPNITALTHTTAHTIHKTTTANINPSTTAATASTVTATTANAATATSTTTATTTSNMNFISPVTLTTNIATTTSSDTASTCPTRERDVPLQATLHRHATAPNAIPSPAVSTHRLKKTVNNRICDTPITTLSGALNNYTADINMHENLDRQTNLSESVNPFHIISSPLDNNDIASSIVPSLAVAPPPVQKKWFYISRFQPHESANNITNYVAAKTKCDPLLVSCFKLVRPERVDDMPLSFISFKISVPDAIESVILAPSFWPSGISISPFLVKPTTKARPKRNIQQYAETNVSPLAAQIR